MEHGTRRPSKYPAKRHSIEVRGPWPIFVALWGLLPFVSTLAIVAAPEGSEARRYSSSLIRHVETQSIASSPSANAATVDRSARPFKNAALEPVNWSDLDGWAGDDHASAFATFYASCRPIVRASALRAETVQIHPVHDQPRRSQLAGDARKRSAPGEADAGKRPIRPPPSSPPESRPIRSALEQVCARAVTSGRLDPEAARQFFEANFVPVRIRKLGDSAGFLTAYYEPIVDGSRFPTREFTVPLYRRPRDLVAPGVAAGAAFPNTGRAFRQMPTGELVPYYDRGEIEDGALNGQHLEICWLRSATDALSVQIEGSARVRLEDGAMLRVSYDAHNGYPFAPISRLLIERHLVTREEMSIQRIREWMHDNPDGARAVRRQNRQVVFFRVVGLNDDTEAIGAQGIPLTAGRSIAVDKALHAYGTPFFIEADLPGPSSQSPFRRLMIAQDTGSAIVGPARADLFFGAGEEAGQMAGRIQQSGRFAMLMPRELAPSIMSASVPLPPAKPALLLASYAFRAVVPPKKPEPSRALRPATLDRVAPPARSEPSQLAARALRPGTLRPLEPAVKREPSRVATPALALAGALPPAKPRPSQAAVRARQPDAPSVLTKARLSEVKARTIQPAMRGQGRQAASKAHQPAADPVVQEAGRRSPRYDRQ
jgi:membrane-bound lytic murein transglycosylase A